MPLVSLYDTDAPTQLAPKSLYCSLEVSCCRFESSTPVLVQSVANVQLISQTALGLSLAVLDTSSAQNLSVQYHVIELSLRQAALLVVWQPDSTNHSWPQS